MGKNGLFYVNIRAGGSRQSIGPYHSREEAIQAKQKTLNDWTTWTNHTNSPPPLTPPQCTLPSPMEVEVPEDFNCFDLNALKKMDKSGVEDKIYLNEKKRSKK